MAKGTVTDVVQQQRRAHQAPLIRHVRFASEEIPPMAHQLVERARSDRERAERMREAGVFRRRKSEVREAQLPQAPQALHCRKVKESRLRCG